MGARAIANRLTARGIPTPAAESRRKRNGVDVPVGAAWHSETVMQLLRNPVIMSWQARGRQSGGTHKRWSLEGPRDIDDQDVSVDDEGCGELVHGHKQHGEIKYICSCFDDSDGKECEHNTVSSERLFECACRLVTHGLGFDAGETALCEKLRDHAPGLRAATPDFHRREQAEFWAAKVETLTADADTAGRRMAFE